MSEESLKINNFISDYLKKDFAALALGYQAQVGGRHLGDSRVTSGAGEHEHNCGQQTLTIEPGEDAGAGGNTRAVPAAKFAPSVISAAAVILSAVIAPPARSVAIIAGATIPAPLGNGTHHGQQFGVDFELLLPLFIATIGAIEIINLAVNHHVLPQRYRAVFSNDHGRIAAHGLEPGPEFLRVRNGGR